LELAEKIDAKRLTLAARSAPLPWAQRLGYLLELVGAKEQARALKDYVHRHARIGPRWFPAPAARAMALETDKVKSTRLAQDVSTPTTVAKEYGGPRCPRPSESRRATGGV
jgi:hypothetical protein